MDTDDSLDNGRINIPASLFYPQAVYADSITDLLVTPGYFAANGDGSYKAVMPYTAQKGDSTADQAHPDGTSNAASSASASTGGET